MSAEAKPAAGAAPPAHYRDPIQQVALDIYVQLCGRIYSGAGQKPDPRAVAQLAFKLAENFETSNLEFNPVAIAAREAKEKAAVNLDKVQIDFGSISKPK
jgi:hypothetical protein